MSATMHGRCCRKRDPTGGNLAARRLTPEALNFVATAMRLNPNYPSHYVLARGLALFAMGDLKQAAEVFGEGVSRNPDATALFLPLSSVLAQLGRREEARQMLLKFRPGVGQKGLENLPDTLHLSFKWDHEHASVRQGLNDGVRVAALPLDVTITSLEAELETGNPFSQQYAVKRLGWFGAAAAQAVPADGRERLHCAAICRPPQVYSGRPAIRSPVKYRSRSSRFAYGAWAA
ncbi:tetratricopeptide repeat protein [Mesorhizobium sangaii]|uniref:Tetratricopeptide (TPR) repeat protein n=1 Tax=Mesorhizobium sangaii TaxID=505389 RepID=A0A841PGY3_9HYPH|nr:tetratricopeptide repeat protein [Mesorhizobium sangaii]MBB6411918.1 tetratricopeptide (TPR) repeat protein [Mesorhizobium sangaii]